MRKIPLILLILLLAGCGEIPSIMGLKFDKGAKGSLPARGVISVFETNFTPNSMGGLSSFGSGSGDTITCAVTSSAFCNGLHSLKTDVHHLQTAEGYVWLVFELGPETETGPDGYAAPQKRDLTGFKYLSFNIMPAQNRTKFYVGLADITLSLGQSIDVPVTVIKKPESWQKIRIALEDFKGIDRERVTKVVFTMNADIETQDTLFYIDDLGFEE